MAILKNRKLEEQSTVHKNKQIFSCSILYQDGLPELSLIVLKRIMKKQWLFFRLKLRRLIYGKKKKKG